MFGDTTPKERIAFIRTGILYDNTCFALAYRLFFTLDGRRAFIRAVARDENAFKPLTHRVLPLGATDGRITLIATVSRKRKTSIINAFRMLSAIDETCALIGTAAIHGDTLSV